MLSPVWKVRSMPKMGWAALLVAFGAMGAGCGNACQDLANTICGCERNAADKQACLDRVSSDDLASKATNAQQNRCKQLAKTCNCNRLACGDLAACGLANDSGFPASGPPASCGAN
jgi:hypothetical protein